MSTLTCVPPSPAAAEAKTGPAAVPADPSSGPPAALAAPAAGVFPDPAGLPPRPPGRPMPPRLRFAVDALRFGRAVVLLDDDDRENEGDLIVAAERLTVPMMATLIRECSGIVCLCLRDDALRRLELPQMVARNGSRNGTAFTVSIEAREGVHTGVSAADRVTTIRTAIAADAAVDDLVSPGHVFPLRAARGGVLERRGHTEGAVDLAWLAGLQPAAVLCELMNPDGTMMRGERLVAFAREHGYPMLTIAELVDYRRAAEGVPEPVEALAAA